MSWFVHDRDLRNEKDVGTLQMCPVKKRKDSNKNTLGKWKLKRTQRLLLRRIFLFGDWKSDKNDENCFIYHLWSCQKTAWLERYDYFKIYDVTTWEINNCNTHIVQYFKKQTVVKKFSPDPWPYQNWTYLWINSLKFYTAVCQIKCFRNWLKLSSRPRTLLHKRFFISSRKWTILGQSK